jgi:Kef-type K+ transport system membrane component KefB
VSSAEFGSFTLLLLLLITTAHLLGYAFTRIRQPRVVGELLAGVLLGPSVLGFIAPALSQAIFSTHPTSGAGIKSQAVIGFLYNLGLLLLMFASGAETKGLFRRDDRRAVACLGGLGTGLPFIAALAAAPFLPLGWLMGPANQRISLLLVIGIAVAVTSIPVISKIFHDLDILHTRFARLILGVAVIEDILLWGVLAVATALAAADAMPERQIAFHIVAALAYFGLGLTVLPKLLGKIARARWNVLARTSPVAYVVVILLGYTALAAAFDVSLVFAAFLAGYALVTDTELTELTEASRTLNKVSFSVFIPVYFAVVGYQLDLTRTFSLVMVVSVLAAACVVKLTSGLLGARLAGFRWRDSVNLAVALNARGGPGIVLASVAYEARIINPEFYTTLVVLAVLTSQAAGAWMAYVLAKGWPLLTEQLADRTSPVSSSLDGTVGVP